MGCGATLSAMSKLALHAILTAAEGKAAELEAAVTQLVAASEEEAGLEVYAAAVDSNNPNLIHFFEIYADEAALGVHGSGDGMKAAMGAVGGLLDGAPVITMLRPFAGKGVAV